MRVVNSTKTITVKKYVADDGEPFDSELECKEYEENNKLIIEKAKKINSIDCFVPFTDWDVEAEQSKIYTINNEEEYEYLLKWHENMFGVDSIFWDKPKQYPVVMLIISRSYTSAGFVIGKTVIEAMANSIDTITKAYEKIKQ